ncbi:unnamed protein product, partial [Coregonus sp. 'balchen']
NSMNLPPDKARLLRQYDNEKKWELICDQLLRNRLQGFCLESSERERKRERKREREGPLLKNTCVTLNSDGECRSPPKWVREFLNEENKGLDVLVEYLSFAQYAVTFDGDSVENNPENSVDKPWSRSIEDLHGGSNLPCNTLPSQRTLKNSRLVCKKDDVHYGFNMVMSHPHAVNEIALSLNNKNPRTKALVLELLAAVCLVRGGHEIILSAFDNFKEVCAETQRFEKLMEHFKDMDNNIDFMVACMQFINIVVHSVEDMNFRDAETKNAALERVEELEENMSHMTEKLQDTENEAMSKIVELEKQLMTRNKELDSVREVYKDANSQVHTLRRMVKEKDEAIQRQCNLEKKIHELEKQGTIKIQKKGDGDISILPSPPAPGGPLVAGFKGVPGAYNGGAVCPMGSNGIPGMPAPPPPPPPLPPPVPETVPNGSLAGHAAPPPPPPPPPPPGPMEVSAPPPPPPPPMAPPLPGSVKIKKPIKTKFRLPVLNWVALKPNQINGTGPAIDLTMSKTKVIQKGPNKVALLDANRAKNMAITLRKVGKAPEEICKAIQLFDLRTLSVDYVECLMRFLPTENEVKIMRQYEKEKKPLEALTDEDRFMMHFSKIERLMQKMTIMAFIGNFCESVQMLTPQLHAIIAASVSIKSSQKLKKILEIILALGNYMNSSKRGAVYGFKLQSLDLSTDRKMTLLHYIANVVKEKYHQVNLFYNELHYVEKAAAVSLENVLLDVKELQRGMDLTKREYSMHGRLRRGGQILWREFQNDAPVRVLPGVCALYQGLQDLRNQPYRRADAVRRSVRRRFDDQNLRPVNNSEVVI